MFLEQKTLSHSEVLTFAVLGELANRRFQASDITSGLGLSCRLIDLNTEELFSLLEALGNGDDVTAASVVINERVKASVFEKAYGPAWAKNRSQPKG